MAKKEKVPSITEDMNLKAKEIIKQGDKTSLESKKLEFYDFLDEYYANFSDGSELLVARKEEILFFTTTSKDIYSSILISLITSAIISFIFWLIGQGEEISKTTATAPLIVKIIICGISIAFLLGIVIYLFKTLINVHNERKKLSDYEILCAKEYEITKINDILAKRFENHKNEVEAKSKKTE